MKNLLSSAAKVFLITFFLCSCSELQLQQADKAVSDLDKVAQGAQAGLESPAGLMIPPVWKLYGVLGIGLANALVITWEEWRNRTMKKTAKAIVQGIERAGNPDKTITDVKSSIAKAMQKQGGQKFYDRANKIVDRLKIA